jgi:hypothetical protein
MSFDNEASNRDNDAALDRPLDTYMPDVLDAYGRWLLDYRAEWDGSDRYLCASLQRSLCLYCGYWYRWDEVHGQIMGGCYPPHQPKEEVRQ